MDEDMSNTNEGNKGVNRSLCLTHEGLNEALKWTDEREWERSLSDRKESIRTAEKYAILYMTLATVSDHVSQRKVPQDNTKYCSSDLRSL